MPLPTTFAGASARGEGLFALPSVAPAATALWFGGQSPAPSVSRITTSGTIANYTGLTYRPYKMTYGPDGNVWGTTLNTIVFKITPTGTITEYTIGSTSNAGICVGPDKNLWVTSSNSNSVYKITTSGSSTQYNSPNSSSRFAGIIAGPDGNLWAKDSGNFGGTNQVWQITTSGSFTGYTGLGSGQNLSLDSDGNIWTYSNASGAYIYRITTGGTVSASSWGIDGVPSWNNIIYFNYGRMLAWDGSDSITGYWDVSSPNSHSFALSGLNIQDWTLGPDGNMWSVNSIQVTKFNYSFTRTAYTSTRGDSIAISPGQ